MRTFRIVAALAGLALVLSACGLVNSLIPDQQVANPLGINGQQLTLGAVSAPALSPQSPLPPTTTFGGSFSGTFSDIDASNIPSGVAPKSFSADIDVGATATLTTAASSLPASFDVTNVSLTLTVKDGSGTPSFTLTPPYAKSGTLLVFTQTSCTTTSSGTSCDYAVTAGPDLGNALVALNLSTADVATLWKIVTGGSATNDASGTVTVQVSQALPADTQLTVTLVSKEGTLSF